MPVSDNPATIAPDAANSATCGKEPLSNGRGKVHGANGLGSANSAASPPKELSSVVWTFLTTLATFAIFLLQGILLARFLGAHGRGEFGTAILFPRDVLLYAGLMGGIEAINSAASKMAGNAIPLKRSALKLGLISGVMTGVVGALLATVTIFFTSFSGGEDKWYLLPFCLFCCLFVPFEHVQLNVSAVDRGKENYGFYNFNRLIYAGTFSVLLIAVFMTGLNRLLPFSDLTTVCGLFLLSRIVGLLPTLRGMELGRFRKRDLPEVDAVPSPLRLLIAGRWFAVSTLATEVFERLDVLLIVALAPIVESGYYFVAVPVAAVLTIAPNALGVFTFNAGADPNRRVPLSLAASVMTGTAVLQILSAIVYSIAMPVLIIAVFKDDFANSIPYALWLLPAAAMKGFLQAADGYLKGRGRPMIGVWSRVFSTLAMIGFLVVAFQWFSEQVENKWLFIPMAACIGQAISLVLISIAVVRDVRQRDRELNLSRSTGEVA